MVALTFVGSDTQHDRLGGEDERRVREGWVNKRYCHSLRPCVHVCASIRGRVERPLCYPALQDSTRANGQVG